MRMNARIIMVDVRKNVSTLSAATYVLVGKDLCYRKISTAAKKVKPLLLSFYSCYLNGLIQNKGM